MPPPRRNNSRGFPLLGPLIGPIRKARQTVIPSAPMPPLRTRERLQKLDKVAEADRLLSTEDLLLLKRPAALNSSSHSIFDD
ncbi:hypothetical protein PtA15_1A424 [Puccinia triticina]|uniref:Uncharacterized protein n=1 Tax=Puccinia triticina TaxID=208348 RepID=A0ABY7CA97_9BASI|nr:uncharacterized protein PtA15_1A424 [Puccinia triticina]WAQ81086.1 hypothetical protein PtA15_1A424 [Puccinia triticina]